MPPGAHPRGHTGAGFVSTGALMCGCSQSTPGQAHTQPWLGQHNQGPMGCAAVGLPSLPSLRRCQEGKTHGSCCLAGKQVSTMWCFSSSLCLSCSLPHNTLFLATPLPALNYGIAKDLSHTSHGRGWSLAGQGGCSGSEQEAWHPFPGMACPAAGAGSTRLARSFTRSLELKPLYHQRRTLSPSCRDPVSQPLAAGYFARSSSVSQPLLAAGYFAGSSPLDWSHPGMPVRQTGLKTRGVAACAWSGWKAQE